MKSSFLCLPFIVACAPFSGVIDIANESGPVDTGSPDDPDTPGESTPQDAVADGVWLRTESVLVEDPCDWETEMPKYGYGSVVPDLDSVLPDQFDVMATEDGFKIKATSYRAQDYITCDQIDDAFSSDDAFSCTIQTASGRSVFAGFTYFIAFQGIVIDSQTIEGTAVVRFEVGGNFWPDFLDNYDLDITQCTQAVTLRIEHRE